MTILIFLLVLAVLIFVHELGHFLAARACGIRVDAFALGFGPKLFSKKHGETLYSLNLIPFGGYVKIHGENPDDDSISGPDKARSFVHKAKWQQVLVLASGVIFNFIFAALLYMCIFMSGVTATTNSFGAYADHFTDQRIMITLVNSGSPADKADIKVGDVIVSNTVPETPITIESIQKMISASNGNPITLNIVRNGSPLTVELVPVTGIVKDTYGIGIAMQEVATLQLPFFTAIWEGVHYAWVMIGETAKGLYTFFAGIVRGTANFSDVSGPVGIAGIVGDAATLGFTYLLMITALISINLGVINLLPFPALDGGRILFVLIEAAIRRRIAPKFSNAVNLVGFALLMILMVIVTYKDIAKLLK